MHKFPFPSVYLHAKWKANHAVQDDALVQKLCTSLANLLGDTPLQKDPARDLLAGIAPMLWFEKAEKMEGRGRIESKAM